MPEESQRNRFSRGFSQSGKRRHAWQ